jgi:hypothetical protein
MLRTLDMDKSEDFAVACVQCGGGDIFLYQSAEKPQRCSKTRDETESMVAKLTINFLR